MTRRPPPPASAIGKLDEHARRAARALEEANIQLVLAESCTAGMVAGLLGSVPGISRFLCGSAVVYQEETKRAWLDIPRDVLEKYGTVAPEISDALARTVLERTPQANLAVAVTGHLGPDAPPDLDGLVYVATQFRRGITEGVECRLPIGSGTIQQQRRNRQQLAAAFVLDQIVAACAMKVEERVARNEIEFENRNGGGTNRG